MALFGSSGIRRIADRTLLEVALRTGLALGRSHRNVVVGRDTRTSGNAVKHALVSGLLSAGARCYDAGILPTPTLAVAAREFETGVAITASHNPPEYNGLKLINPDGSGYGLSQQAEMEKLVLKDPLTAAPWEKMATDYDRYDGAVEKHISHIVGHMPSRVKLKVVVDCACGAACVITPYLLGKMGCEVIALNSHPSGFFPRDPEPVEKNLVDLVKISRALGAIGIAHDGDADRMMAVDEKGRFIPGDKLLVLLARQAGATELVTTVDASMAVEDAGFKVRRTKVGDTFVSEELRKGGGFGGEPSGAWIFPKSTYCPDGIYAAAMLVSMAAERGLAETLDQIPQYPVVRGSVAGHGVKARDLATALMGMNPQSTDESDGLKLIFNDGWLLVRPSGTEPKIRITSEARGEVKAHERYDRAVELIGGLRRE